MTNDPNAGGSSGDHLDSAKREALAEFTTACEALIDRIRCVSAQVEAELATVKGRTDWLIQRAKRLRFGMRILYGLSALVTAAAIALAAIAATMAHTQSDLQKSDRLQTDSALCPLYSVFINADTPQARERAERQGTGGEARADAFAQIRESYTVLGCMPHLNPDGTLPR